MTLAGEPTFTITSEEFGISANFNFAGLTASFASSKTACLY